MAAPATIGEFLEVARKSHQIDNARLEAYLQETREKSLPREVRRFAQQLVRDGLLTVFQAEQFLQGKYKGFHLGGYRILERLGAGGAGTVYLGEHAVLKRRVALKVLPTPFANDPELLERFRLEARAAAVLDHPNVVRVFDLRQEGRLHFIVMEYIDGPNLQQVVSRKGPLPVAAACEYARQAALGLQHAHEAGLVHRDVKPANLLIDPAGTVKVLDLGLARYEPEGGGDSLTQKFNNKMVLGTADYLAPEQAMNLHGVDPRADIYSLGGTLYTLLAGRPPFHEASIGQKLMWHQVKQPDPVTRFRPEVPEGLAAVVARALAKRPEDRFASMAAFAEALVPWADSTPQPEPRPGRRTMLDLRLGPTTPQTGSLPSGRLAPAGPSTDTLPYAQDDTGSIVLEEPERSRPTTAMRDLELGRPGTGLGLAVLVGLVALVAGLAGGVVAFLLWGPRVG